MNETWNNRLSGKKKKKNQNTQIFLIKREDRPKKMTTITL